VTDDDQTRLDRHFENIRLTALADLRTLADADADADAGGGVGVFLLAGPIIDVLASAARTERYRWKQYIESYMPRLATLAPLLWDEFRRPGGHSLSAGSRFRFTSGEENRWAHTLPGTDEAGRSVWYLHASEFAADVEAGFDRVWHASRVDDALRTRMLTRLEREPPVGPSPELEHAANGLVAVVGAASTTGARWPLRHLRALSSR
jgi:hypothetical protein